MDNVDEFQPGRDAPTLYYSLEGAEEVIGLPLGCFKAFGLIGTMPHLKFGQSEFLPCYIVDILRQEMASGGISITDWIVSSKPTIEVWQVVMRMQGFDDCGDVPVLFLQGLPEIMGNDVSEGAGRVVRGRWDALQDYACGKDNNL